MSLEFDRAQIALGVVTAGTQVAVEQGAFELGVDAVAAVITLMGFQGAVGLGDQRAFDKPDAVVGFDQGAAQRRNHCARRVWRHFAMLGVAPAQYMTCVLQDGMLETATGAEERTLLFTGVSDRQ